MGLGRPDPVDRPLLSAVPAAAFSGSEEESQNDFLDRGLSGLRARCRRFHSGGAEFPEPGARAFHHLLAGYHISDRFRRIMAGDVFLLPAAAPAAAGGSPRSVKGFESWQKSLSIRTIRRRNFPAKIRRYRTNEKTSTSFRSPRLALPCCS